MEANRSCASEAASIVAIVYMGYWISLHAKQQKHRPRGDEDASSSSKNGNKKSPLVFVCFYYTLPSLICSNERTATQAMFLHLLATRLKIYEGPLNASTANN